MAKIITLGLVFALVVSVPLRSVLCQDDPWQTMINEAKDEAKKVGVSQDTINEAQKVIGDGSAQKLAEDAFGGGSLDDWVQQAKDVTNSEGSAYELPQDLPDDEEEDNLAEAPEMAPKHSTIETPIAAPTNAPSEAPTPFAATF